jgi:hypothetical protein
MVGATNYAKLLNYLPRQEVQEVDARPNSFIVITPISTDIFTQMLNLNLHFQLKPVSYSVAAKELINV